MMTVENNSERVGADSLPAACPQTVLEIRWQSIDVKPTITTLCPGYEFGRWRTSELADDVFNRHLTSFALCFTENNSIDGTTAVSMLRKAAQAIYTTEKYRKRGEFGELLLHAVVKDFFGSEPAISKIYYKDSPNDTVKGFDCVHIVEGRERGVELWLGEVKYYKDLSQAINDCVKELKDHLKSKFLRTEFIAITNKLDQKAPFSMEVGELINQSRSLDEIVEHLVIPVMLTYDSKAVASYEKVCEQYIGKIKEEAHNAWIKFRDKMSSGKETKFPITLHLILLPLDSKDDLTKAFHEKLTEWQGI